MRILLLALPAVGLPKQDPSHSMQYTKAFITSKHAIWAAFKCIKVVPMTSCMRHCEPCICTMQSICVFYMAFCRRSGVEHQLTRYTKSLEQSMFTAHECNQRTGRVGANETWCWSSILHILSLFTSLVMYYILHILVLLLLSGHCRCVFHGYWSRRTHTVFHSTHDLGDSIYKFCRNHSVIYKWPCATGIL